LYLLIKEHSALSCSSWGGKKKCLYGQISKRNQFPSNSFFKRLKLYNCWLHISCQQNRSWKQWKNSFLGRIWIMWQICVILVCHEYGHVWVEEGSISVLNLWYFRYIFLMSNLHTLSYNIFTITSDKEMWLYIPSWHRQWLKNHMN
jgi:hypothetical protein